VAAVTEQLPRRGVVGRGEVAGSLGHRFAVAYGLAASAGEDA
jgi:Diol dehydratase reactivase ATPase-like domain.